MTSSEDIEDMHMKKERKEKETFVDEKHTFVDEKERKLQS